MVISNCQQNFILYKIKNKEGYYKTNRPHKKNKLAAEALTLFQMRIKSAGKKPSKKQK